MTKAELLKRLLEDLSRIYVQGLYEFLYAYRPAMYRELVELETSIDEAYLNPETDLREFKQLLRLYWAFHVKAAREFKTAKAGVLNLTFARQRFEEERIKA